MSSVHLNIGQKIRPVRRALDMSQSQFARAYHVPLRSLQNWQQGAREPDESVEAPIRLIDHEPELAKRIFDA